MGRRLVESSKELKRGIAETIAAWQAVMELEREGNLTTEDVFFDAEEGGGVMVND